MNINIIYRNVFLLCVLIVENFIEVYEKVYYEYSLYMYRILFQFIENFIFVFIIIKCFLSDEKLV